MKEVRCLRKEGVDIEIDHTMACVRPEGGGTEIRSYHLGLLRTLRLLDALHQNADEPGPDLP